MSTTGAARAYPPAVQPASSTPARSPRRSPVTAPTPRLRLVRAPAQARTRTPFVLVCMGVLAVALLSALLLNTQMAANSYEKFDLSNELARLDQDAQDLTADLDAKSSPSELAHAADLLGMVPSEGTGWIRLEDGKVQGAPAAGGR